MYQLLCAVRIRPPAECCMPSEQLDDSGTSQLTNNLKHSVSLARNVSVWKAYKGLTHNGY